MIHLFCFNFFTIMLRDVNIVDFKMPLSWCSLPSEFQLSANLKALEITSKYSNRFFFSVLSTHRSEISFSLDEINSSPENIEVFLFRCNITHF